jgi:hypothetical protein
LEAISAFMPGSAPEVHDLDLKLLLDLKNRGQNDGMGLIDPERQYRFELEFAIMDADWSFDEVQVICRIGTRIVAPFKCFAPGLLPHARLYSKSKWGLLPHMAKFYFRGGRPLTIASDCIALAP